MEKNSTNKKEKMTEKEAEKNANLKEKQSRKQETIMDTANTKDTKKEIKKNSKLRMILVLIFLAFLAGATYVQIRGNYLEYLELGEQFASVFKQNLIYRYSIMGVNFVILYIIMYFTNRGIKKGLKPFFEKENKKMPKLLNKSLALVISAIASIIVSAVIMQNVMLAANSTKFAMSDPVFNLDVSYFVFIKPLMETLIYYFIALVIGLSIYMALYYVIVFNKYFDGIDGKMLKQSDFMKKLLRNVLLIVVGIALLTIVNIQNIVFGKILTINDEIDIVGAGIVETTVKLWGYIIFAFVIVIFSYRALKAVKDSDTNKILKNLAVIPAYLIVLFVAMVGFDLVYVNKNELDKEKSYIQENIKNTKNAYNINVEEQAIQNSGTITDEQVKRNNNNIKNIPIVSQEAVLKTLQNNQTETGYFSYRNVKLAQYKINGEDQLVYVAPREIKNSGRTYTNKTYEYTHGMGQILVSATESNQSGNVQYVQKEVSGKDEKIKVTQPRMYFGLDNNGTVATNAKKKQEYDYTDENGVDQTSTYNGKAGLKLGFLDRLILGITKGDIKLAFSNEMTKDSKILINRNVIERAQKALPYLIYDENPYTVIDKDGKIKWVIDAYTVSSSYPYSQYTSIEHDGAKQNINYIRNSVKVIIDSYDGSITYYITDRTDPIAMAYWKIYKPIFADIDEKIPEDISKHLVYPKYLYDIQAQVLKTYHNVKPDVLYRADDLWDIAKYNSARPTKAAGMYMPSYYTSVKENNEDKLGLIQMYTPNEKQNIISYLVGTANEEGNKLKLYKFSADSNIVGPMQLDKQIEEDEVISAELEQLNVTGTKLTKQMLIIPIENTLLYVEPIYQTMLNESDVPILKKVVVASGNKVAIGDTLELALENLLSKEAGNIEVENTDDINGLIDAIIKANKNLEESNANNDWEMMGKDVKKLQELINSLEEIKKIEDKKIESQKLEDKKLDEKVEDVEDVNNENRLTSDPKVKEKVLIQE